MTEKKFDIDAQDQAQVNAIGEINAATATVHFSASRATHRPNQEMRWLKAFEKEVQGRLAKSLHNQIFINLDKQVQPGQVPLWNREVKSGPMIEAIPPETDILTVFNRPEIAGKLLILGKPGAGKTTTLLELAEALVRKAIADPNEPIPFLLNLSSWKDPKQSIKDWTIAELTIQGISSKLGKRWLEEQKFLPLFDGLDEVRSELQPDCVRAINQFMSGEAKLVPTVVCSRQEEYELYPDELYLKGSIYLKDLKDKQIEEYLMSAGRPGLCEFLLYNSELLKLIDNPLLLSILMLAYPENTSKHWEELERAEDQVQHLLDRYVEEMLHRNLKRDRKGNIEKSNTYGVQEPPSAKQTRRWLVWLSQQMEASSQTEFLIEQMQPRMLTERQKWKYQLRDGLITGLLFSSIVVLINPILIPLVLFITPIILSANSQSKIEPVERLRWSWRRLINRVLYEGLIDGFNSGVRFAGDDGCEKFVVGFSIIGTLYGLAFGALAGSLIWQYVGGIGGQIAGWLVGIIVGIIGGIIGAVLVMLSITLLFGLIFGLIGGTLSLISGLWVGLIGESVEVKVRPNQGIRRSAMNSLCAGLIFGLIFGLGVGLISGHFFGLPRGLIGGLRAGLFMGLLGGLTYGGRACIQHISLRLTLYQANCIPWKYARFLNYATERMFLQRIGGRYRFIHKLLQDHFSAMGK